MTLAASPYGEAADDTGGLLRTEQAASPGPGGRSSGAAGQ